MSLNDTTILTTGDEVRATLAKHGFSVALAQQVMSTLQFVVDNFDVFETEAEKAERLSQARWTEANLVGWAKALDQASFDSAYNL